MSPITQTSFLSWTFFAVSYSKTTLALNKNFKKLHSFQMQFRKGVCPVVRPPFVSATAPPPPTGRVIDAYKPRTTDTQWRHKTKISEKLGRCGRQNMLRPYLKIWEWEWIFGRAVKFSFSLIVYFRTTQHHISSLGVRSPWYKLCHYVCHTVSYLYSCNTHYTHLGWYRVPVSKIRRILNKTVYWKHIFWLLYESNQIYSMDVIIKSKRNSSTPNCTAGSKPVQISN